MLYHYFYIKYRWGHQYTEHVDAIHKASFNALTNWWMQSGVDVDIEKLIGTILRRWSLTEPVQNQ